VPAKIKVREAELTKIRVEFVTSDHRTFYLDLREDGFRFYSKVNSAGNPEGNAVFKSIDDCFEWIGDEGSKKKFRDRKDVQPKKAKK
jgi:hypothetical protein